MGRITIPPIGLLAFLATTLPTPTRAQSGGFAGFGGGDGGGSHNPYSADAGANGDGDSAGYDGLGSGYDSAVRARAAHGILACIAFVVLFPLGVVLLRVIPGRWSSRAHWVVQMMAWVLYIAAFALGVELIRGTGFPGGNGYFISNPSTNYHPIIGIVVFILLLIQPLLGIMHHRNFKALQRRTLSSYLHVWNGRVAIILGIINGGLGLRLAGAGDALKLAYTIIAAIFGGTWIVLAVLTPALRSAVDSLATRPSDSPSETKSYGDDVALLDSPEHGAGPSYSNSISSWKRGPLARDKLPQFADDLRRIEQAGSGQDEVAGIPVWQLPTRGVYELPAALPEPSPVNDAESAPRSAPHCPASPSNDSSDMGEGDADSSDLFLGSGPSFRVSGITINNTTNTTPASPTLALRRNDSLPDGTSGLLNLHDARNEVLLLLDRLLVIQGTLRVNEKESMYQSGRVCALGDVQEALLRRSELSHVGTAEGRILRREATNLDGMRNKVQKEGLKALAMNNGLGNPTLITRKLHEAIVKLFDEAHAALQTVGKMAGEAASNRTSGTTADATAQTAQYTAWKDHHRVRLTSERVLESQIERFEKENEQQRKDISRLQGQLDDLRAHRSAPIISGRNVPHSLVPGPPVPLLSLQLVRREPSGAQRASAPWSFTYGSEQEYGW